MLRNLVRETANNPGTGSAVTLGGAPAGFRTFAAEFGAGAPVFYFITDGAQTEAQAGTLTVGPPASLSRGTPIWTSVHGVTNPARLNFTGTVSVFCQLPANRAMYADGAGIWDGQGRRFRNIAKGTDAADVARRDQVGWEQLGQSVSANRTGAVFFNLLAGYMRFRIEWMDFAPVFNASAFLRFATGGSLSQDLSNDYGYNMHFLYSGTQYVTERIAGNHLMRLTGDIISGAPSMCNLEVAIGGGQTRALWQTGYTTLDTAHGGTWGVGTYGKRATGISLQFMGQDVQYHRIKILGSRE